MKFFYRVNKQGNPVPGTLSSLTYSFIWNGTNNTNVLGIIVGSGE